METETVIVVASKLKDREQALVSNRSSAKRSTLVVVLTLAALTFLLYQSSLRNQFVNYDDPAYVTKNVHVLAGISWANIVWAFTSTAEANWHPVTWISHMTDVQIFKQNPLGHHFTNVLLHVCNVVLLFLLLRAATGSVLRSALVAALFSVHPLNVESVAWVAERKSLLSTFFLFLALGAWGRYVRKETVSRYLTVVLFFALGLMAKPMVITFPFMLLLLDYWPLERIGTATIGGRQISIAKALIEKIPLFVMSAASAVVTVYAQRSGGALGSSILLPLNLRIKNAIYSYLVYLSKGVWPSDLAVFYPHPEFRLEMWRVFLAAAVVLTISSLVWCYRQKRYLVTGWLWFLGTMLPVIGIVQVGRQAWADRYAYVPFIGLFVIAVWLGAELLSPIKISRAVLSTALVAIIFVYASVSYREIAYWRNSYTLFSRALEVTSNNAVAEDNLGEALVTMGHPEPAIQHFQAATRIAPELSTPHYNLGTVSQLEGKLDDAQREYGKTLLYSSDPVELTQTHNNLGALLMQIGRRAEAKQQFDAALNLNPSELNSLIGRGMVEYQKGSLDLALRDFTRAVQIAPSAIAYFWKGRTLEDKGNLPEAAAAYTAALQISPDMQEAQTRLQGVRSRIR